MGATDSTGVGNLEFALENSKERPNSRIETACRTPRVGD